jgi:hypothetical protein
MTKSSKVLRLGKCRFRVESEQSELIEAIEALFSEDRQPVNGSVAVADQLEEEVFVERLVDLVDGEGMKEPVDGLECHSPVIALVNRLYGRHGDCIWLDAASLLSPTGRLVLLAGPSHSGKTTLSLGLALSKYWSILSEDITLIDPQLKVVYSCPTPSKLRAGTAERLAEVCPTSVDKFPESAWFFDESMYAAESLPAKFELALYLDAIGENDSNELLIEKITPAELLKRVLPISNLLKLTGRADLFYETVETASCLRISGGKLGERIDLLESIVKNID